VLPLHRNFSNALNRNYYENFCNHRNISDNKVLLELHRFIRHKFFLLFKKKMSEQHQNTTGKGARD